MLDQITTEIAAETINRIPSRAIRSYALTHYLNQVSRFGENLVPPAIFIGAGDFLEIGKEFFRFFIELAELKRGDQVLDVGCGQGRMAIALTHYLNHGTYDGIEVVPGGVEWCRQQIASKHPNFRFHHADVFNKEYNPQGSLLASEYVFPFPDNHFDFVYLTSVFTHLLPQDVENYLAEIARVMRPGGRCLITYFLINSESLNLMVSQPQLSFQHQMDGYRTIDPDTPESAIAFDQEYITSLYPKVGLEINQPIHFGNWCDRQIFLSFQDLIVATKR